MSKGNSTCVCVTKNYGGDLYLGSRWNESSWTDIEQT